MTDDPLVQAVAAALAAAPLSNNASEDWVHLARAAIEAMRDFEEAKSAARSAADDKADFWNEPPREGEA